MAWMKISRDVVEKTVKDEGLKYARTKSGAYIKLVKTMPNGFEEIPANDFFIQLGKAKLSVFKDTETGYTRISRG